MKTRNKILGFLILLSALSSFAQAQNRTESQSCDVEFVRQLVQQQVSDTNNTDETDERIKILIRSADFLWEIDEDKARDYLAKAFTIAEERFRELGFERKKIGSYSGGDLTVGLPDYRFLVIREIAKKDREWADRLIKKSLEFYERDFKNRTDKLTNVAEIGSIMSIAFDTVESNPERSLSLYRIAMKYPLDRHWFWSFYMLWRKNPELANVIYSEALNNYKNELPSKLLFLSAYPFGSGRFFGADRYSFPIGVPQNYVPQTNLQVQFLNIFLNRAENVLNNPNELNAVSGDGKLAEIAYIASALNELEPYVAGGLPDLIGRLRSVKFRAYSSMNETVRAGLEQKENEFKKSGRGFKEILKAVENAHEKGTLKDQDIIELVLSARTEDDYKLAEDWIDKIKNSDARREILSYFFYKRAELAVKENRLREAESFAEKITVKYQKGVVYFKLSQAKIKETNQKLDVERLLLDVSKFTDKMETSVEKAQILFALAASFEDVNHFYALDELGNAVKVLNKLEKPDLERSYINKTVSGDGFEFLYLLDIPYDFDKTFEKISKNDFLLSLAHAQSIDDKFFKTTAVLAVAKNCLEKNKRNIK